MKNFKKYLSLVLSVLLVVSSIQVLPAKTEAAVLKSTTLVDNTTDWKYLDDNTDPAGSGDRTSWTENTYDDTLWSTGKGKFGAKNGTSKDLGNGFTADVLLNQRISGTTTNVPTFFFRTSFHIDSLEDFSELKGELQYDDAAIVYINGIKVAAFDEPTDGFASNMSYGGSNATDPKTGVFTVTGSAILFEGDNQLAVELHQGSPTSSDIFMNFKSLEFIGYADYVDGFARMEAENYSTWSDNGLKTENSTDSSGGNLNNIGGTYSGAWLGYEKRNFDIAPASFSIRYVNNSSRCAADSSLEIRLGSIDGELLQTISLPATGSGWNAYAIKNIDLENAERYIGTQDIYFVMNGTTTDTYPYIANIDYFQFNQTLRTITQKAISINVGSNESERNITWYADEASAGSLQLAMKRDMTAGAFPEAASTTYAASVIPTNNSGFYSNQLTMAGLEPDTEYVYRLINGSTISDTYSFTTGTPGSFNFLFAGDPQIGAGSINSDITGWRNTLTKAFAYFSDIDFIANAGDQVNTASDENQYAGFLNHEIFTSTAISTVIGNHDTSNVAYKQHFNNPNTANLGITTAGSDYWYVYNNVLFMNLNSNNLSTAEHRTFMQDAINANPLVDWKIVVFHHSLYSVASHATDSDILQRRQELVPVFKELDVDVVLMGHDHVYVRTYMMDGLTPIVETSPDGSPLSSVLDPEGILYVTANSASGSKYYSMKSENYAYAAVKNQENTPNISHVEVSKNSFKITTYRVNDMSEIDSFEIKRTSENYPYTKVAESVKGVENDTAEIAITKTATYDSGVINPDGGSTEIVKYNKDNSKYYVINGTTGSLDIIPREIYTEGVNDNTALGKSVHLQEALENLLPGFSYGDLTTVDINTTLKIIAVGIQGAGTDDDSMIAFLNYEGDILKTVTGGKQVDMITFTPDGSKLLAANEGEPRDGYGPGTVDPKGSVTVVDLSSGLDSLTATNVTFDNMDANRESLVAEGVIIKKDTQPSLDFEPEYIAVDSRGQYAYVALQEANAIATLDLTTNEFISVKSLGFKNHNLEENALDLLKDNKIDITTQDVYGIYMPDGISVYEYEGKTYLLTANEGDSRDWNDYTNEKKKTIGGVSVTTYDTTDYDGLDSEKTYIFGGRSFSVYDAATMEQIYDSGSDFEKITAEILPEYFNCSNDNKTMDNRSGKKGPEPESVVVGKVGDSTYAFIALERIGGIMVYDITNPFNAVYVNYINSRDFSQDIAGDVSPEGLYFVEAEDSYSNEAEIFAAFEVSGTVGIYEVIPQDVTITPTPTPQPPVTTPTPTPQPPVTTPTPVPSNPGSPTISLPTPTPDPEPEEKEVKNLTASLSQTSFTYSGKEHKPAVIVRDGNKTLSNGTDYTVSYSNNIKMGTGFVTVTGLDKYKVSVKLTFIIIPKKTDLAVLKVTTTSNTLTWSPVEDITEYEIFSYRESTGGYVKIKSLDSVFTKYTVKKMTPGTTYRYKIRSYKAVDGKKYYSEFSEVVYTSSNPLAPTGAKVVSGKSGTKTATLTWKSGKADGYQIYMSGEKNGTYTLAGTVKGSDIPTFTKAKLASGKTYYFKIRAYHTVDGRNYYSNYSKVVSVKVK